MVKPEMPARLTTPGEVHLSRRQFLGAAGAVAGGVGRPLQAGGDFSRPASAPKAGEPAGPFPQA